MTAIWRNIILIVSQVHYMPQVEDKQKVGETCLCHMFYFQIIFLNYSSFVHPARWVKTLAYTLRESLLVPTLWISLHISSSAMVLLKCHSASIESIHLFYVNKFRLLMPQTLQIRAKQIFSPILGNGHILASLSSSNSFFSSQWKKQTHLSLFLLIFNAKYNSDLPVLIVAFCMEY